MNTKKINDTTYRTFVKTKKMAYNYKANPMIYVKKVKNNEDKASNS